MNEPETPSPSAVRDSPALGRFEMAVGGDVAFVTYRRLGGIVTLNHSEVPVALRDRGIGSALAKGTLDLIRDQGFKVVPKCPFMAEYVRAHPAYLDLLALPPHH